MDISKPSRRIALTCLLIIGLLYLLTAISFIKDLQILFEFVMGDTGGYSGLCDTPGINCASSSPMFGEYVYYVFQSFVIFVPLLLTLVVSYKVVTKVVFSKIWLALWVTVVVLHPIVFVYDALRGVTNISIFLILYLLVMLLSGIVVGLYMRKTQILAP